MVALTIGMATYKDFDGVYFTIQALRLYQDLADTELVVVDNFGDDHTREFVEGWAKGRYVLAKDAVGTAAAKNVVFQAATGDAVLCCDSHVHFYPGVIARLKAYYRDHPGTRDLLQGPLVYDDLTNISTHFAPEWRGQMWGTWATDERGQDPEGEPFDIPMQGMGVFSCWRTSWPGFNPQFRGFGGEEGYIHEKVRQRGGRTLCAPWLRWVHRFGRPAGAPYPLFVEDKLRNYVLGFTELGLDLTPVTDHFKESLPVETVERIVAEVRSATSGAVITPGFTPVDVFTDMALANPVIPASPIGTPVAPTDGVGQESKIPAEQLYDANSPKDVLVIVPTRSRPDNSIAFAETFFAHSTRSDLVFALDEDDPEIYPVIPNALYEVNPRLRFVGTLNLLANKYKDQYTYLVSMGDDNRIRTPAWDQQLVEAIEGLHHGVAYGNDLFMGERLPTAAMINASIVRTLGYMAPPSLVHLYADNFWLEIGTGLGTIRYRDDVIIEHMHYTIGKAEPDTVYLEANSNENLYGDAVAFEAYKRDQLSTDLALLRASPT